MRDKQRHRRRSLDLIDTQSGGDVSRIVCGGVKTLPGNSVRAQQQYLEAHGDGLRRLLLSEPYGSPAQSVNLIVAPGEPRAHAGYIIMEAMGYPLYSGSNTICTATALLQSGHIPIEASVETLLLESPAGLTHIQARCSEGYVQQVTTQGEAAYLAAPDLEANVPGYGQIRYDVVWCGGFFAMIDAESLGFDLVSDEESALAACAHEFVKTVRPEFAESHPEHGSVAQLPFVHFMRPGTDMGEGGWRAPSATYVDPHVICRSPTGTGTSARLALMAEREAIEPGAWLQTVSPRGASFTGTLLGATRVGGHRAWDTHITGSARALAHSQIVIDLDDPLIDNCDLEPVLTQPEEQ